MDKQTVIAFVLIGLLLIVTQTDWYKENILGIRPGTSPASDQVQSDTDADATSADTVTSDRPPAGAGGDIQEAEAAGKERKSEKSYTTSIKELKDSDKSTDVTIRTNLYSAVISGKGATVTNWQLDNYFYDNKDSVRVQMITENASGNLGIAFPMDRDTLWTHDFYFTADKTLLDLSDGKDSDRVVFELQLAPGKLLRKIYTFYRDEFAFDLSIELVNMKDIVSEQKYTLYWLSGLRYTEKHVSEDIVNSKAYIFPASGKNEELSLSNKPNVRKSKAIEGQIDWVGIRTKYFASVIIPTNHDNNDDRKNIEARVEGVTKPYEGKNVQKIYSSFVTVRVPEMQKKDFKIYVGPMDYDIIKAYHPGFDKIMGYGPMIIRPFAKLTLRVFKFLHSFIPNYGVVLILFSILIKLVVYPLTRKSYHSMREMQKLQPLLTELKEKYGNDPKRLNTETMALYKDHGVNPMSGCLPMVLQMPLLWAVFLVFRNTIQLRQAPFMLWINDLSSPDTIAQLPFSLPLLGSELHIIPLVMGATMLIQQKMTMTDPKQKAMMYFMPLFLTVLFYNFPSGLNIYYTLFNIFTIVQQRLTTDQSLRQPVAVDKQAVKGKPRKGSKQ